MNASVPSHLTVRNLPRELARALRAEQRRRGASLNQTVLDLLTDALGLGGRGPATNGLERFAGTWSAGEAAELERNTAIFEAIDEELWR